MSQHNRGAHTFEIDGKSYVFVLDLSAMAMLEEMFSTPDKEVSFNEVMGRLQKTGQIRYARAVVWALLQHHHPEITLDQAGHLFTLDTMMRLNEIVEGITKAAIPDSADARELGLDRPQKARVNGRSAVPTTGVPSKSKHASLA